METKQATPVFKSPTDSPVSLSSGPDGGLFVALDSGHIQQLDNSFMVTKTFHFTHGKYLVKSMCHLPAPHNTLVINKGQELRAISLPDGQQIWNQKCEEFIPLHLLCPQQDVLLVSADDKPQVHVVNPCDGMILQTIEIPNIRHIDRMCLCNDQIVLFQLPKKYSRRKLLSYYRLKRII